MLSISVNPRHRAVAGLVAGNLLLATLGVFVVESRLDPITIVFWRCVIGTMAIGLYCYRADLLRSLRLSPSTAALAVLSGVLMVGNWVVFFSAINRIGIAVATIVFHVQPFLVVLLGAVLFREALTAPRLAWVALAFAGLLAAIGPEALGPNVDATYIAGIGFALAGAALYAGVTLIAKRLSGVRAPVLTLVQCVVGVPLLGLMQSTGPATFDAGQWGWLAGIGLIHTGVAYALIYGALPALTTPVIAVLAFLYPAGAVIVDAVVYGHLIDAGQAAGLGLIVFASLGVTLGWSVAIPLPGRSASR